MMIRGHQIFLQDLLSRFQAEIKLIPNQKYLISPSLRVQKSRLSSSNSSQDNKQKSKKEVNLTDLFYSKPMKLSATAVVPDKKKDEHDRIQKQLALEQKKREMAAEAELKAAKKQGKGDKESPDKRSQLGSGDKLKLKKETTDEYGEDFEAEDDKDKDSYDDDFENDDGGDTKAVLKTTISTLTQPLKPNFSKVNAL